MTPSLCKEKERKKRSSVPVAAAQTDEEMRMAQSCPSLQLQCNPHHTTRVHHRPGPQPPILMTKSTTGTEFSIRQIHQSLANLHRDQAAFVRDRQTLCHTAQYHGITSAETAMIRDVENCGVSSDVGGARHPLHDHPIGLFTVRPKHMTPSPIPRLLLCY